MIQSPSTQKSTMQSTNFSITVSIQMCNFSMNAALFRRFACCPAAFLAVWGGQPKGEPPLADFKFHAARVRVCVGLAALAGVSSGIGGQPVLEVGVVGANMDKGVFLVKPYCSCLAFRFNRLCICSNRLSAYSDICSHKNTCPVRNTPDN